MDYGLFTRHLQETGHRACQCGGYYFAHRPNSPYCYKNTLAPYRHAARAGTKDDALIDAFIDCVWEPTSRPVKPGLLCPF